MGYTKITRTQSFDKLGKLGKEMYMNVAKAAFKSIQEFIIERQLETTDILEILK